MGETGCLQTTPVISSNTLQLDVGGVTFQLGLPSEELYTFFQAHYHSFLSDIPTRWKVALAVDSSLRGQKAEWVEHNGAVTRYKLGPEEGWIDLDEQQASVTISRPADARMGLNHVLSYICLQELPRHHNALYIHGAGVVIGGGGYIFFGASGQGKSTVSRLAKGVGQVLSDEGVIARLGSNGATLASSPFWGTGTPIEEIRPVRVGDVPLRAMYSLVHAPRFELSPLRPAVAVMELLTSEKIATERVASANVWLEVAQKLVAEVPLYRLGFLPTPELWGFLGLNKD